MGPFGVVGDVIGRVCGVLGGTVERFVAEVRRQIDAAASSDGATADDRAPDTSSATGGGADNARTATDVARGAVPAADELALPDYDVLAAAHVVAALGDLDQDERDAIEAYERAGRHRRTILGRLDQLRQASEAGR